MKKSKIIILILLIPCIFLFISSDVFADEGSYTCLNGTCVLRELSPNTHSCWVLGAECAQWTCNCGTEECYKCPIPSIYGDDCVQGESCICGSTGTTSPPSNITTYSACNESTHKCYSCNKGEPGCTYTSFSACENDCKIKWCCRCNGSMNKCYECPLSTENTTAMTAYFSKSQCEKCCPCGTQKGCFRYYNNATYSYSDEEYCLKKRWCEEPYDKPVCTTDEECGDAGKYSCATYTDPWTCRKYYNGDYDSKEDCEVACVPKYTCNTSTWKCEEFLDGDYDSKEDCEKDCGEPPTPETMYKCNLDTFSCSESIEGSYVNKPLCESDCRDTSELSDFDFDIYPRDITITRPSSGSVQERSAVSAYTREGVSQLISFTQTGFPDGVSASDPAPCKPERNSRGNVVCTSRFSITVQSSASLDTSIITMKGTAEGGLKKTKTYKLVIQDTPPPTSPDPTTPLPPSTKYSCNETNWTCEEDPNGTTWDICEANCIEGPPIDDTTCEIYKFSINEKTNEDTNPLRVWVDASLKGYFSVNYVCTSCTVTSVPSDGNENWTGAKGTYDSLPSSGNVTEPFKINTAGTYSYTLECIGTDPEDIVTNTLSLQTVEALNLPWWQEIIPVLRGFLGGV